MDPARSRKVLEHIDAHLDDALTVEHLSEVAGLSKFHFHRRFAARVGMGVHRYVQLLRLRRASYELAFRERGILEIALASGYESHEAFTRAFKRATGQTPSAFRAAPRWEPWLATQRPVSEARARHARLDDALARVTIVDLDEIRVAALEHRGPPELVGSSLRRFIAWRRRQPASVRASATYNLVYDDPDTTTPARYRLDVCAAIARAVAVNAQGVVEKRIAGGRCAFVRHHGSNDTLADTVKMIYARWIPARGEAPRDAPVVFRRLRLFPDVPEHEAITDVFVPLR